jgi:asparagine synthase (glutamine-hydrolysing)
MASLGGRSWIVGRIRLDGRQALQALLAQPSGGDSQGGSDAALCLQAYAAWGADFVDHLAGDFCFVLWDQPRQRLIAVRDQLGVRALFEAGAGGALYISDSLDWIVSAAPIGRDLDEQWIADFLGAGFCLDVERTVWRRIRRLAPAHMLTASDAGVSRRRYWRLEIGEPIYWRDRRQYGERFRELLSMAIADRLPAGRVGISMSGGLDSTTLAAVAVDILGDRSRVAADCLHFEWLMADQEKHFAALAASHLGIGLTLSARDDLVYDPDWRSSPTRSAEPSIATLSARPDCRMAIEQASRARVWLFGEGPDNALMFEQRAYFSWLLARRDWRRLGEAGVLYLRAKGLDGWGQTLRRYLGRAAAEEETEPLPSWLVDRVGVEERLLLADAPDAHPWHPRALGSFNHPIWSSFFAGFDSDETLAPIVWRHPYLDLRVLQFMLSVPPVPWARRKLLLREAMRGRLPEAVLARNKTPLAQSPFDQPIRRHGLPALSDDGRLTSYVDVRMLPQALPDGSALERLMAVHALDHWLGQRPVAPHCASASVAIA